MHNWRVALLPFLEEAVLYDQYDFDQPWNSPNNQRIANQMPDVFRCPSMPDAQSSPNMTNYVVVLGKAAPHVKPEPDGQPEGSTDENLDTVFGGNRWTRLGDIEDGTSNTLLVVEVRDPVPWTKPGSDLHFEEMNFHAASGNAESYGSYHPRGANAVFMDGSVHFLSEEMSPQTWKHLIQPADGHAVRID